MQLASVLFLSEGIGQQPLAFVGILKSLIYGALNEWPRKAKHVTSENIKLNELFVAYHNRSSQKNVECFVQTLDFCKWNSNRQSSVRSI